VGQILSPRGRVSRERPYFGRRPLLPRTPRLSRIALGNIAALTPTFTGTPIVSSRSSAAAAGEERGPWPPEVATGYSIDNLGGYQIGLRALGGGAD